MNSTRREILGLVGGATLVGLPGCAGLVMDGDEGEQQQIDLSAHVSDGVAVRFLDKERGRNEFFSPNVTVTARVRVDELDEYRIRLATLDGTNSVVTESEATKTFYPGEKNDIKPSVRVTDDSLRATLHIHRESEIGESQ